MLLYYHQHKKHYEKFLKNWKLKKFPTIKGEKENFSLKTVSVDMKYTSYIY